MIQGIAHQSLTFNSLRGYCSLKNCVDISVKLKTLPTLFPSRRLWPHVCQVEWLKCKLILYHFFFL